MNPAIKWKKTYSDMFFTKCEYDRVFEISECYSEYRLSIANRWFGKNWHNGKHRKLKAAQYCTHQYSFAALFNGYWPEIVIRNGMKIQILCVLSEDLFDILQNAVFAFNLFILILSKVTTFIVWMNVSKVYQFHEFFITGNHENFWICYTQNYNYFIYL